MIFLIYRNRKYSINKTSHQIWLVFILFYQQKKIGKITFMDFVFFLKITVGLWYNMLYRSKFAHFSFHDQIINTLGE